MWQDAWWLARKEIKYSRHAIVFTLLAVIFIAVFTAFLLEQFAGNFFGEETKPYNDFLMDFIFIGITPSLAAIFMSGPYLNFSTIKEDPFSKRMAFYRSLPVSVAVLSFSRTLLMLVTLLLMSGSFYLTMYLTLSEPFFQYVTKTEFIFFAFVWFGYALAFGGANTFIEAGTNGKVLMIFPFFFILIVIMGKLLFFYYTGQGMVEWSFKMIKAYSWYPVVISMACGVIGSYLWNRLLKHRLLKRDYV